LILVLINTNIKLSNEVTKSLLNELRPSRGLFF
jgi:hypothetical protein